MCIRAARSTQNTSPQGSSLVQQPSPPLQVFDNHLQIFPQEQQGETMWHILNSLGPDEETFLRITRVNVLKVHYIGFLAYIGFKVDSVAPLCNNMRLNWFYRHTACLPGIIWMVFVKLASGKTLHQVVCRLWQCPILLPVAGGQGSAGLE